MLSLKRIGLPAAFGGIALAGIVVSCTTLPPEERSRRSVISESWHSQRMILLEQPPRIAVDNLGEIDSARLAAKRADPDVLAGRLQARLVGIDALPYLIGSSEGRRFLQARGARALARGRPALSCPSTAVITHSVATPREVLASEALNTCIRSLPPGVSDCGCELVAIDNLVTVTRDELSYATGSTARLSIPSRQVDRLLVAEEDRDGTLLLRDLNGPVAKVTAVEREVVEIRFETGAVYSGRRIKVGFRRGRMAERIYATSATGERLSLLIGFEPDELAEKAAAWLAWPNEG